MNRQDYDEYVAAFNSRDYELLHSRFFHPDVENWTVGHVMKGEKGVRAFYDYFHKYVDERLNVITFADYPGGIFSEVEVTLTGKEDLTEEINAENGFPKFPTLKKGDVVKAVLFANYQLKDGKMHMIKVAEYMKPKLQN